MNSSELPSTGEAHPGPRSLRSLQRPTSRFSSFAQGLAATFFPFQENMVGADLWRMSRADKWPLLLIVLLPLLVALPQLLDWLKADPLLYVAKFTKGYAAGFLPGVPYIDPNNGFQTQALGYRAAVDWLHGNVPWWNPYSGVGMPLAAEYQPGAFFPLTLMLLLPQGIVWQHVLLQVLSGWGTYGLLRQLGLSRTAALTGGLLYAFNGTLTWLDHGPAMPVPFLPWMLWGLERAYVKSAHGISGGWRMFAIAMAMNLLASFPETAYLNGLFCLAWAALRWAQTSPGKRKSYVAKVAAGGCVGVVLCAPQIVAFFEFLPHAGLDKHGGAFAHIALPGLAALPSLVAPHVYGPPFGLSVNGLPLGIVFGNIGGYVTLAILLLAVYGALSRRDALGWLMVGWSILALAKTFGFGPAEWIWNLIPGITSAAFFRYIPPTWELCLIVLAARCVDQLQHESSTNRPALLITLLAMIIATGASAATYAGSLEPHFAENWGLRYVATLSMAWAALSGVICLGLLVCKPEPWRAKAAAALLAVEAVLMSVVPTLSNPRAGTIDMEAISFLRENLGFQRFFTLGPLQPNYGAYFGIASINHNYLPVSQKWVDWIHQHLDKHVDPVNFTGNFPPHAEQMQELRENLEAYQWAGVKYVITSGANDPFSEVISSQTGTDGNKPLPLQSGQTVTGVLPANLISGATTATHLAVMVGNYNNTANGTLKVVLCSGSNCQSGSADLTHSQDNAFLDIPLAAPLQIIFGEPVRYSFEYHGGASPAALWAYPTKGEVQAQKLSGPEGVLENFGLRMEMRVSSVGGKTPKQVYSDEIVTIYELPDSKPYFESLDGACSLQAKERTQLIADCKTPATIVRRELFFPGWSASINGQDAQIVEHGDLFQTVKLEAGKSTVVFRYAPPHIGWAWAAMWLALAILIASVFAKYPPTSMREERLA